MKPIRQFLVIFTFAFVSPLFGTDFLAADGESAKYRTGVMDPLVQNLSPALQDALKSEPEASLKPLVLFLTAGTGDDFIKIKRLHDWITENIAYDNDQFYGVSKGEKPLLSKRTTCGGFASLFSEMAKSAGFETLSITGRSRSSFDSTRNAMSAHVWNAVKIKGKWYLVDTTHDGRFSFTGGVWGAKMPYRDTQLFISYRGKLLENIPDNPEHQFLTKPLGLEEFLSQPLVSFRFLSLGLSWKTDIAALVKKDRVKDPKDPFKRFFKVEDGIQGDDRVIRLELLAPEVVSLFAALLDGQGRKIDSHAFTRGENGNVICEFSAPSPGSFSAYISARKNPEEKSFSKVYEFQLRSDLGAGPELPAPGKLHLLDSAKRYGLRVLDSDVTNQRGRLFLEWEAPKSTAVYSAIWDAEDKKIDGSSESKILSAPEAGVQRGRLTYAVPTKPGTYTLKVRVKHAEERLYSDTAAVARILIP